MKLAPLVSVALAGLAACASAQKPERTASSVAITSAEKQPEAKDSEREAEASPKAAQTTAEQWAEKKVSADPDGTKAAPREAGDPLAMNSEIEESSIPKVDLTPASQVRPHSPGELNASVGLVASASSVDEAAKKLTQRLGAPSWIESLKGSDAKRRVWIAPAGPMKCQRLVLEPDGTVDVETSSKTEWRMLAASARQNPCSGEIQRGISR
jgi:hypothetical protein